MTGWIEFEARIEPVVWGKATYTVLVLPRPVADALAAARAKRVEGEMNEHPVNLALSRAPVIEGVFLWAGRSLLDRIGAAPGDLLDLRLRPAPPDRIETPEDVAHALRAGAATTAWDRLTPGKRRGLLYQIETAKTAPTRAKRIATLVHSLTEAK